MVYSQNNELKVHRAARFYISLAFFAKKINPNSNILAL